MENNGNQNLASSLCQGGCGFFGSAQFDGMCSKCYKDSIKRKQAAPMDSSSTLCVTMSATTTAAADIPDTTPSVNTAQPTVTSITKCETTQGDAVSSALLDNIDVATGGSSSSAVSEDCDSGTESPSKSKRNRCYTCKKKVGLTGFECRCGGLYCGIHRYSDKHSCEFDYKEHGADEIRKTNPVVVGTKVQKL